MLLLCADMCVLLWFYENRCLHTNNNDDFIGCYLHIVQWEEVFFNRYDLVSLAVTV
jgi:hypothetical protein